MKFARKIILGSFILVGLQFVPSSCATDGAVSADTGVYYGHRYRDPWFHDDPWGDGHGWHRGNRDPSHERDVDIYISPPRLPGRREFGFHPCARFHRTDSNDPATKRPSQDGLGHSCRGDRASRRR